MQPKEAAVAIRELRATMSLSSCSTNISVAVSELEAIVSLSWPSSDKVVSPAEMAAAARHASCYEFLASIGGAAPFLERLRKHPFWLDDDLRWLLSKPSLLDMTTKQAWLHYCIENKMKGTQALVTDRNNLVRACAELPWTRQRAS